MTRFKKENISLPILLLLATAVWIINLHFHPDSFQIPDALIHADVARHLVAGQKALTDTTWPMFLTFLPAKTGPWPSPYPLLHSYVVALSFFLFGVSDFAAVLTSGFFFIATLVPLFLLSRKINRRAAYLACLWYLFNPDFLSYSLSGTTESFFTFLVTTSLYCLFLGKNLFLFLSGALIGLAGLTRFQGLLLLPAIGVFIWLEKKQAIPSIGFLGGFLSVIALSKLLLPPIAQNYADFPHHELWATLASTAVIPPHQFPGMLSPVPSSLILSNLDLLLLKALNNLYYFFQRLYALTLPPIIIFYALSFFKTESRHKFRASKTRTLKKISSFKWLSLGLFLSFLLFHLLTLFDFRFFHPLVPVVTIFAAGSFISLLEKLKTKKVFYYSAVFTFLLIAVPAFTSPGWGTSIQRSLTLPRKPTVLYLLAKIAQNNTSKNAILAADRPTSLTWWGKRKTVQIPFALDDLTSLDRLLPLDALFLSNYHPENYPEWQNLIENPRDFGNFYFAKEFEIRPEDNYYRIPIKAVLYLKKPTLSSRAR